MNLMHVSTLVGSVIVIVSVSALISAVGADHGAPGRRHIHVLLTASLLVAGVPLWNSAGVVEAADPTVPEPTDPADDCEWLGEATWERTTDVAVGEFTSHHRQYAKISSAPVADGLPCSAQVAQSDHESSLRTGFGVCDVNLPQVDVRTTTLRDVTANGSGSYDVSLSPSGAGAQITFGGGPMSGQTTTRLTVGGCVDESSLSPFFVEPLYGNTFCIDPAAATNNYFDVPFLSQTLIGSCTVTVSGGGVSSVERIHWRLRRVVCNDNIDSDEDGLSDCAEYDTRTDPFNPDSDGDTLSDGDEIAGGTDPLNPDSDGDGLDDALELSIGTNPIDADTDRDGVPDGIEVPDGIPIDTDGDGIPDVLDNDEPVPPGGCVDTDGDGFSDLVEITYASDRLVAVSTPVVPPGEIDEAARMSCDPPTNIRCEPDIAGTSVCDLLPGDIVLWKSGGGVANTESFFGATHFTHSGIVVGRFRLRPDQDIEVILADITPNPDDRAEFALSSIDVTNATAGAEMEAVGVYRPNRTRISRDSAARKVLNTALLHGASAESNRQSTIRWDAPGIDYPTIVAGIPKTDAFGPTEFYCSSLVAWAYGYGPESRGSAVLGPLDKYLLDKDYITPDALLRIIPSDLVAGFNTDAGTFAIFSPAHVEVTDPNGRRTGWGPDAIVRSEIPGASWIEVETNEGVSAPGLGPGWTVTLTGHQSGPYVLTAYDLTAAMTERHLYTGFTRPGQVETFDFADIAALRGSPVAFDDQATTPEDAPADIDVLTNDLDPADSSLQITATSEPAHGTASAEGGVVRYEPDADYSGPDFFEYTITNADGQEATGRVDIDVVPVNDDPTVVAVVPARLSSGAPADITATAVDVDEGDTITLAWSLPTGTPCTVADPGAPSTTVTCDESGTFDLTVVATDSASASAIDTATFTVVGDWLVEHARITMTRSSGGVLTLTGVVPDVDVDCRSLALDVDDQPAFDAGAVRIGRTCLAIDERGIIVLNLRTGRLTAALRVAHSFSLPDDVAQFGLGVGAREHIAEVPGLRRPRRWSSR